MDKKTIDKKFEMIKAVLNAEIDGKIDLPDKLTIFTLSDKEISSLITKKRMELIKVIGEKQPLSIKQLADFVKRKLPAVDRDIKLLVKHDIIKTKRSEKGVQPILKKGMILIQLTEPEKMMEIAA